MESISASSRIMKLAAVISHAVEQIQGILSEKQLPSPSFHENSPYVVPPEAVGYQGKVLDAAGELCDLLVDPFTLLFQHGGVSSSLKKRKHHTFIFFTFACQ
jgi:hypothetical protein